MEKPKIVLPCTPKMFEELTGLKADFVLRAVNSHEELLEALKLISAKCSEAWLSDSMAKPENKKLAILCNQVKTICEAAISKAEAGGN